MWSLPYATSIHPSTHPFASDVCATKLLPRLCDDALVLAGLDIVDGAEEMALGVLQTLGIAVCVRARKVRVDQLNQPIEIFCRDLFCRVGKRQLLGARGKQEENVRPVFRFLETRLTVSFCWSK
jgi:hypothetical protein